MAIVVCGSARVFRSSQVAARAGAAVMPTTATSATEASPASARRLGATAAFWYIFPSGGSATEALLVHDVGMAGLVSRAGPGALGCFSPSAAVAAGEATAARR